MRAAVVNRLLLLLAVVVFFVLQLRLFASQADCSQRITSAEESQRSLFASNQRELQATVLKLRQQKTYLEDRIAELQEKAQKDKDNNGECERIKTDCLRLSEECEKEKTQLTEDLQRAKDDRRRKRRFGVPKIEKQAVQEVEKSEEVEVKLPPIVVEKGADLGARAGGLGMVKAKIAGPEEEVLRMGEVVAAVVVMACNRADYLKRTLESVLSVHRTPVKFPLFISQDGTDEAVKALAKDFPHFHYLQHIEDQPPVMNSPNENRAYYRIAAHYRFALSHLFDTMKFARVIILEDDMELAPDFFGYFEATSALLDVDETLLAVSSWNDNGQTQFVKNNTVLYRSDFFPGLGWMLRKELWDELGPKWPKAYWDDWLRLETVRKGRQTIRPEICRTYNFGEHGSSQGQFYYKFLKPIKLNDVEVNWKDRDLSYLLLEEYGKAFARVVNKAKLLPSSTSVEEVEGAGSDVTLSYTDEASFAELADRFGIFTEWKDKVPRTAFKGVVVFWHKDHRVYLTNRNVDLLAA